MKYLQQQAYSLMDGETDLIAILSNLSALINETMDDINWVGFYLYKDDHLVLGPFQGKTACIHLYPGKGVCSHALESKKTTIVDDVHEFPGHVACDSASRSELVIPMYVNDEPFGVLDIDSPSLARFSQEEAEVLEKVIVDLLSYLQKVKTIGQ